MRTIITDLDRTLLLTDKTIFPYTQHVLICRREKGIVILADICRQYLIKKL